tara:strand:- start:13802 stop:14005 length:204 start_codon:yes stop_codon:yes gene_type:complete
MFKVNYFISREWYEKAIINYKYMKNMIFLLSRENDHSRVIVLIVAIAAKGRSLPRPNWVFFRFFWNL